MATSLMVGARELAGMLDICERSASKIIGRLNEQLAEKGYETVRGKVPRRYLNEKIYGGTQNEGGE